MLAVIETHPVQYHAPVYRAVQQVLGLPVAAIYGSDFSVSGYRDEEFGTSFAWDTDLLRGYDSVFLSRVGAGGARSADAVPTAGMREALEKLKPSAVLVVGYSPRFHRVAWREGLRTGVPLLFRGETRDDDRPRPWWKSQARELALRLAYSRCARILHIGEMSRRHYLRLGVPEERLTFSPYCVDETTFSTSERSREELRPPTRRELGLDDSTNLLLFSGKLIPRKATALLIQAVRRLPDSRRARLVVGILGDGPERSTVEQLAAETKVATRFIGFRNQRELSRYYHAADLVVLPSRVETWGLVVNEALLHGVPTIVSSGVGAGVDLIEPGTTGDVFENGSAESLAGVLVRAHALIGRPDIRVRCQARVARYSVRAAAEGIAGAYRATTARGMLCV